MADSIAIIGAGIAGLAAGCYARMNGYATTIFELHDKPGGLCTSWKRKGFTFDGCLHWLVGTQPGSSANALWRELGALRDTEVVNHEIFTRIETADGRGLDVYTDIDSFEQELLDISPGDARAVREFTGAVREFSSLDPPMDKPTGREGGRKLLEMLPHLLAMAPVYRNMRKTSVQAYFARFEDPFLRETLTEMFNIPDFPITFVVGTLGWLSKGDAGYPVGGSLAFARNIEHRFVELGGEMAYKSRVEKIQVEGGRAVGVRLEDGTEHRADWVVSAADGHATIFDMLEGRYTDPAIRGYYADFTLFDPIVQVSLGLADDMAGEGRLVNFPLAKPVLAAGRVRKRLNFHAYTYDPTLAPKGKTAAVVLLQTDYDYWKLLAGDKKAYKAEKESIAKAVIGALEERFPGLGEKVEVIDVATPMTYERYTGNWRASMEGWLPTLKTSKYMMMGMRNTLPGLDGLYMAGQWIWPGGGVPPAAMTAKTAIRQICKKDGKIFTATEA